MAEKTGMALADGVELTPEVGRNTKYSNDFCCVVYNKTILFLQNLKYRLYFLRFVLTGLIGITGPDAQYLVEEGRASEIDFVSMEKRDLTDVLEM